MKPRAQDASAKICEDILKSLRGTFGVTQSKKKKGGKWNKDGVNRAVPPIKQTSCRGRGGFVECYEADHGGIGVVAFQKVGRKAKDHEQMKNVAIKTGPKKKLRGEPSKKR